MRSAIVVDQEEPRSHCTSVGSDRLNLLSSVKSTGRQWRSWCGGLWQMPMELYGAGQICPHETQSEQGQSDSARSIHGEPNRWSRRLSG
ncbi:unnamed protein product [Lampetra planeri]